VPTSTDKRGAEPQVDLVAKVVEINNAVVDALFAVQSGQLEEAVELLGRAEGRCCSVLRRLGIRHDGPPVT
jgi:hypothetical protein